MNQTPFEQFIALVQVDQKINGFHSAIADLEKQNAADKKVEESNRVELEKIKTKLHDTRKEVDAKELEMKTLDLQETEKKARLDKVANHKEYQSIKDEIDQLKKAQHALEDLLMTAWNHLETVKREHEHAQQAFEQKSKQLHEQIDQRKQKIAEISGQMGQLAQERVEKEKGIPAEWLEKYVIMRSKVSNPVVPVIDGNCSACFYKVSAPDMQSLRHRKLIQCKDCFRLLYLEQAQQEPA